MLDGSGDGRHSFRPFDAQHLLLLLSSCRFEDKVPSIDFNLGTRSRSRVRGLTEGADVLPESEFGSAQSPLIPEPTEISQLLVNDLDHMFALRKDRVQQWY